MFMINYKILCIDCGDWSITDSKTGETKTGTSHYIVAHKDGNCKPVILPCSADMFKEGAKYVDMVTNILFDEKGRVAGISPANK